MFERYNEKARRVVFYARFAAIKLGGLFIEPEHILLAILGEDPEIFQQWLKTPEDAESLRVEVEQLITAPQRLPVHSDMPLSHSAKRVLAYGAEEAERLHHGNIRPAHLLAGLLREQDTPVAAVLRKFGINVQQAHLVFVTSSKPTSATQPHADDLHKLVDQLPPSQLGRAQSLLQALLEADRSTRPE